MDGLVLNNLTQVAETQHGQRISGTIQRFGKGAEVGDVTFSTAYKNIQLILDL